MSRFFTKKIICSSLALLLIIFSNTQIFGQDYPAKPINYIIPFAPGGDTDLSARVWAEFASKLLGQPVVVINKTGAGGVVGTSFAATSAPDGYTIFAGGPGPNCLSMQINKVDYTVDSFIPVARIMVGQCGLFVSTESLWKTEKEFVADAKKNPGKYIFGASGVASWPFFAGKQWANQAGVDVKWVQYQGSAPIVTAMLGKNADISFGYSVAWGPQAKAGTLRALAIDEQVPGSEWPGVPTFKELGYQGNFTGWAGIFVPKGTPAAVVKKLSGVTKELMNNPEYVTAMKNVNCIANYLNPEDLKKSVDQQYIDLGKIVDELNMRAK